jgi:hypothetical protein
MKPRKVAAWVLLLTMSTSALPAETLVQHARKIPRGAPVRIQLKTHQKVEGRLGEVTETQLRLEPFNPGTAPASSYSFQDISKIRSTERKPRKTWVKVLAAPVVYPLELIAVTAFLAACGATKILGQGCLD